MINTTGFLSPPVFPSPRTRSDVSRNTPMMSTTRRKPPRLNLMQAALLTAGALAGNITFPLRRPSISHIIAPPVEAATVVKTTDGGMPLSALGVRRDQYVSERELRRRKTTQYSEAEEEIMELEEWEIETQWFKNLQALWAAIASCAGIYVLYRGGVMWENWIKEQEKKDMEEEIKLTGTFIDPRAVRKDEDDDPKPNQKRPNNPKKPDSDGGDNPPSVDSLNKLFGQS